MTKSARRPHRDVPGRAAVLLFTTRRRISEQRMHRSQTVYVSMCPVMDLADDDLLDALSEPSLRYWLGLRNGRYGRLNRPGRSPVGGVVLRPVGDALTAVQVLRTA